MKEEEIIKEVESILNDLEDCPENRLDKDLPVISPYRGKGPIKLIIIGQDPTVGKVERRKDITCTLNLDKKSDPLKTYVKRICDGLSKNGGLSYSLDNIYATNLFKYFYTKTPSTTYNVLEKHLKKNLDLLKRELEEFKGLPIITLGEPVLKLLTNNNENVRKYWKSEGRVEENENELHEIIYPFPHEMTSNVKELYSGKWDSYIEYVQKSLNGDLGSR